MPTDQNDTLHVKSIVDENLRIYQIIQFFCCFIGVAPLIIWTNHVYNIIVLMNN